MYQSGGNAPGIVAPSPQAATTQVDPTQKQAAVAQATQLMQQGADGQKIANALLAAGVPPDQWPQSVQLAARGATLGISR
jgi:hypothetical protein